MHFCIIPYSGRKPHSEDEVHRRQDQRVGNSERYLNMYNTNTPSSELVLLHTIISYKSEHAVLMF